MTRVNAALLAGVVTTLLVAAFAALVGLGREIKRYSGALAGARHYLPVLTAIVV